MCWKWGNKIGYAHDLVIAPKKLETIGIKRLVNEALMVQGVRKKSQVDKKACKKKTMIVTIIKLLF